MKKLSTYNEKRRFDATPEPAGAEARSPAAREDGGLLVIQKHRATRLHYDVRLELDGVLVSWAVPKGPSLDPRDRRLAVHVEDHPLDYQDFEGVIPAGNYGAGEVIVWDRGTWRWTPTPGKTSARSAGQALAKGKLDLTVASEKLRGRFVLVRTGDTKNWMLIKVKDEHARPGSDIEAERPESVKTGRKIEELKAGARGEERWSSHEGLVVPEQHALPDLGALLGADAKKVVAKPLPGTFRPLLATRAVRPPAARKGTKWLAEILLEGVRVLAWKDASAVRLVSSQGDDLAKEDDLARTFPEVARSIARLPARGLVLDAVIAVLDTEGRSRRALLEPRLAARDARAIERLSREEPAVALAFDLLALDGRDLTRVPLAGRKKVLAALLPGDDERLRYLSHLAHMEGRAADFLEVACEKGLAGIVVKNARSRYVSGRSRSWLAIACGEHPV